MSQKSKPKNINPYHTWKGEKRTSNPTFRSGFEKKIWEEAEGPITHEPDSVDIRYTTTSRYIPDFQLPNGILIETKGYFPPRDRSKMLKVKKQNPKLDIRFVFQRPNNKITKSKNSIMYWEWAERHGFKWADGHIPLKWWKERKRKQK